MPDQIKCKFSNLYSELEVIIIDELSMMFNKMLLNVHKKLCEIFRLSCPATTSKITIGFCTIRFFIRENVQSWVGSIFQLTEFMRKQGDNEFITLLNSIRIGTYQMTISNCSNYCEVSIEILGNDVNVLFAENDPKVQYSCMKLVNLQPQFVEIFTIVKVLSRVTADILSKITKRHLCKKRNLASQLKP